MPEDELLQLCECGCGQRVAKKGNRFIRGHNRCGVEQTSKSKRKISKAVTQYYDDPTAQEAARLRAIKQFSTQKGRKKMSDGVKKRWLDPEEHVKASIYNKKSQGTDEAREANSKRVKQYYIDNPQHSVNHGNFLRQWYIDNPIELEKRKDESIEYYSDQNNRDAASERTSNYFKNNPEAKERLSALKQGQNYDDGEWTGFSKNVRDYVIPIDNCIKLNTLFVGAHAHHITKSIVAFIPRDLHDNVNHNIKTGYNMGEINMLALQFINGCYDG